MEKYYNKEENKFYYEGQAITRQTKGGLFSGIPSTEQLEEWGYEKVEEPKPTPLTKKQIKTQNTMARMAEIKQELQSMDYLTHKYADGEDMSQYGDWQGKRIKLREEYRKLEASLL